MKRTDPKDDEKTAPESGDPLDSGRSRGKIVSDSASDDDTERAGAETTAAPESGRHGAAPASTRPNLGTRGS